MKIVHEGTISKFLRQVEQVTYSGAYASQQGRSALYITERAVFELTSEGLVLTEIAPGISLERDILPHMEFRPIQRQPLLEMDPKIFQE